MLDNKNKNIGMRRGIAVSRRLFVLQQCTQTMSPSTVLVSWFK